MTLTKVYSNKLDKGKLLVKLRLSLVHNNDFYFGKCYFLCMCLK